MPIHQQQFIIQDNGTDVATNPTVLNFVGATITVAGTEVTIEFTGGTPTTYRVLLETGDILLLEDGNNLRTE
jgi:hypothetical protein